MDHNSIIDKNTYEVTLHAEDNPNVFICDKMIATSIALLNKKGYKTYASCSGHYKLEFYEWFDEDISKLEEYQNDDRIIIKKIKENSFDYWSEVDSTLIYVLFARKYHFNNIPEGFYEDSLDDRTCINHKIYYYDKENNKKSREVVENEINNYCKKLEEWVKKLPEYERND